MSDSSGTEVAARHQRGHIVHLVGPATDVVLSFLGPITLLHAEQGLSQTVVLVDEPAHRKLLNCFHSSVQIVRTTAELGGLQRWRLALRALLCAVAHRPTAAVHLHGVIPSLLGVYAARFMGLRAPLYFSPHGSRLLGPLRYMGAVLMWLTRPLSGHGAQRAIANSLADADRLRRWTGAPVVVVESPVHAAFFAVPRREAAHPVLLTASRRPDRESAARFAQLAVILSEESLAVNFGWIGTSDAESLARLAAANVEVHDVSDAATRAELLASGTVYVALGGLGFPLNLAEAMAAGLPCVVWDTPYHRDLVEHGKTGLVCHTQEQLLACVAELIDSAEARRQLGQAGRALAEARFSGEKFRESYLAAFGAPVADAQACAVALRARESTAQLR